MQEQLEKTKCSPILGTVSDQEAAELCRTLREELIRDVSQTGGHLASNLGAVELTVALHRVLDTSRDRWYSMWATSATSTKCSPGGGSR